MTTIEPQRVRPTARTALQRATLEVHVHDLGAEVALAYHFENHSPQALEALFTFPMPRQAAFLGLEAQIGGHRLAAQVQASAQAVDTYDEALAQGHSALLLEQVEPGLLHATLGNLGAGEQASFTLRFVLPLETMQGQARLRLPLVLRPRYGHWFLDELQQPETDAAADYPLQVHGCIDGLLADARIGCPTHPARLERQGGTLHLELTQAWLDGDFVLDFQWQGALPPSVECFPDGEGFGVLAHLVVPPTATPPAHGLDVALVLDGSGSMNGDAIVGCRSAFSEMLDALTEADRIQVLRFGTGVHKLLRRPLKASAVVRKALHQLVPTVAADLGGTEIGLALSQALASLAMVRQASPPPHDAGLERAQGVILVTDGAVQPQDVDQAKAQAVQAGMRVFIVAVGSSAGVEVLAPLAQATGGQLECVVPGDSIRAAVLRQLARMRQARPVALRCQFDAKPQALTMPAWVYGGDAVRIAAWCAQAPGKLDVMGPWEGTLALAPQTVPASPARRALLGQALYNAATDETQRESLAIRYGLLSPYTSAVVVHQRAQDDRLEDLPAIQVQPQMLPRGMGTMTLIVPNVIRFSRSTPTDSHRALYLQTADPSFSDDGDLRTSRMDHPETEVERQARTERLRALALALRTATLVAMEQADGAAPAVAAIRARLGNEQCVAIAQWMHDLNLDFELELNPRSDKAWWRLINAVLALELGPALTSAQEEQVALWLLLGGLGTNPPQEDELVDPLRMDLGLEDDSAIGDLID